MALKFTLVITSPSGRQFESCKEASMYLLSVLGEDKLDKPNQSHNNDCDNFALKGASGNVSWYLQLVLGVVWFAELKGIWWNWNDKFL